jgi:hypothetical protein
MNLLNFSRKEQSDVPCVAGNPKGIVDGNVVVNTYGIHLMHMVSVQIVIINGHGLNVCIVM